MEVDRVGCGSLTGREESLKDYEAKSPHPNQGEKSTHPAPHHEPALSLFLTRRWLEDAQNRIEGARGGNFNIFAFGQKSAGEIGATASSNKACT